MSFLELPKKNALNGCFQLDGEANLYLGNGWKSPIPSILIRGCFGYQEEAYTNWNSN